MKFVQICEKITQIFIRTLFLLFVILGIGYLIVHFQNDPLAIPFILIIGIFGIYQIIIHIFYENTQQE